MPTLQSQKKEVASQTSAMLKVGCLEVLASSVSLALLSMGLRILGCRSQRSGRLLVLCLANLFEVLLSRSPFRSRCLCHLLRAVEG